jgi:hypothetical protein
MSDYAFLAAGLAANGAVVGNLAKGLAAARSAGDQALINSINKSNRKNTLSTTKKQAFIVDTITRERLEIMFFPEGFSQEHNSHFGEAKVVGMSHPQYQWTDSEHLLSFALGFHSENVDYTDVLKKVEWLESLTYPEYAGDRLKRGPHEIVITFGEMFKRRKYILLSASPVWGNLYHPHTMIPIMCTVELKLRETVDKTVDYSVIRKA